MFPNFVVKDHTKIGSAQIELHIKGIICRAFFELKNSNIIEYIIRYLLGQITS